ncbi:MAG: hypothetical protein ACKOPT_05690 [Cyanobium sp.]
MVDVLLEQHATDNPEEVILTETTAPQGAQPDCARLVYEAEQAPLPVHCSSKKPRGLDRLKEVQPPAEANAYTAQLRKVRYGPATLDAFLMPDGTFRFSMRSAAASVNMLSNAQAQRTTERVVEGITPEPKPGPGEIAVIPASPAQDWSISGPPLVDVPYPGPTGYATTLSHQTLIRFWGELSRTSPTYGPAAVRMLEIGAEVSLIALCQQAFGIVDHRSVEERLLEAWIDLGTERPEPLFDAQFRQFYESVVGHRWGSPATASCLADLVYHRIPPQVYQALKDINPVTRPILINSKGEQVGFRERPMHTLISDPAFARAIKPIVEAAKVLLAITPKGQFREVLRVLDSTNPRYKCRGRKALCGASNQPRLAPAPAKWPHQLGGCRAKQMPLLGVQSCA